MKKFFKILFMMSLALSLMGCEKYTIKNMAGTYERETWTRYQDGARVDQTVVLSKDGTYEMTTESTAEGTLVYGGQWEITEDEQIYIYQDEIIDFSSWTGNLPPHFDKDGKKLTEPHTSYIYLKILDKETLENGDLKFYKE